MPRRAVELRNQTRVSSICAGMVDAVQLRHEVLDVIRRAVPFDAYAWVITDPETSVGSAPLAEVPWLSQLPTLIRLKYLTPVNRWTGLRTGRVRRLREATAGNLAGSLLWRELLSDCGVVDIASCVFRDRFGCWGFLDLWRVSPSPPFTEDDATFLGDISEPLTSGLRRSQAYTFTLAGRRDRHEPGPALLLLSPNLEVRAQTPETERYLRTLVPPPENRQPIPAGAYNVAAQLLATEQGVDANQPSTRVHLDNGMWLTLRAARIGDPAAGAEPDIAVTLEVASPMERLGLFTRAYALTRRETQLIRHLATGSDTRDTARGLFLSEHTVQDHLKSVFAKTSTHSRHMLLSRALGTWGAAPDLADGLPPWE